MLLSLNNSDLKHIHFSYMHTHIYVCSAVIEYHYPFCLLGKLSKFP